MFWIKLMKKNQQPVLNPVDDFKKQARKKLLYLIYSLLRV